MSESSSTSWSAPNDCELAGMEAVSPVELQLREIVAKSLSVAPEQVVADALFIQDLGADSLDVVNLAMRVEDVFGITIKDTDYLHLTCLADAVTYIEARISGAAIESS